MYLAPINISKQDVVLSIEQILAYRFVAQIYENIFIL